ncbi:MAG: hypothetical protein V4706_04710 [Pseudomonadota bacterium]
MKLNKTKIWLESENKNENLLFLCIGALTWLLCFVKPIMGKTYTSWDTHDIGFVNFLYFSDALRGGSFALWNHLIQSGTFFPSFNNIGLFSPFQLIFVALSWLISPVYAYELMIQAAVLTGAVGSYLLVKTFTSDRLIALFGATAFAVVVLVPIVGQIAIVVSLGSLPWLFFACVALTKARRNALLHLAYGILAAFYLVSGYLWMNLINLAIVAIFLVNLLLLKFMRATTGQERKSVAVGLLNLSIFFGAIVFFYGSLLFPGYLSMEFNYSVFIGDYINPEPRLRGLVAPYHYAYSSVYKALIGAIDPRIVMNNGAWMLDTHRWSWGAGWVLLILFLGVSTRKLLLTQLYCLGLVIVALLYSAGDSNFIGKLIEATPVLNANRWWFIGVTYATAFIVFLAIPRIVELKERGGSPQPRIFAVQVCDLQLLLVGIFSICLLYYFNAPLLQFLLVVVVVVMLLSLNRKKDPARWQISVSVLICINVLAFVLIPYGIPSTGTWLIASGEGGYSEQIRDREKNVDITQNLRRLGKGDTYIFNDKQWLLKKIPFTHGYNNLGNPLVWYVKNEPFLERLLVLTRNVRPEMPLDRKSLERPNLTSDNEFVKAMMGDVLADMGRPTIDAGHFRELPQNADFHWTLDELNIAPNTATMRVTTNAAAYLVLNNVNHPGWKAYVDGKRVDLINTNRIFQGVFLAQAGSHEVVFKFRPMQTIALILSPYIILLFSLMALFWKFRMHKALRAN